LAASLIEEEPSTPEELIAIFEEDWAGMNPKSSPPYTLLLGGSKEATAFKVNLLDPNVGQMTWLFVYYHQGIRGYLFITIATPGTFDRKDDMLTAIWDSVEIFQPQLYGLPNDQTLHLLGSDPDEESMDPATTPGGAAGYVGLLFSGLVRLNPSLQIEPDLAESWEVSPDGTVYTFTLRTNIAFTDGTPIYASDVQDSWERAADPKTKSSTARTYLGDILGFKEKLDGRADSIAGVRVLDSHTLQVTLDGAKGYFLAKLTYPTSFVVDMRQVKRSPAKWMLAPNASGPYSIKTYEEGESLVFERNNHYPNPPAIQYLVYTLNIGGSFVSLYEEGLVDVLFLDSDTALRVRKVEDPLHAEWSSTTSMCTTLLQVNNTMPPFEDINVRQAFALAVDRTKFVQTLSSNIDIPSLAILPPSMPGFSAANKAVDFNPTAAQEALAASSYAGNLPTITLNASGFGSQDRDDVTILVETWRKNLGVEVEVQYLDPMDYTQMAREQHGQMVLYGWCADYPDPENFLDVLYHSKSEFNVSGYTNDTVDELLESARVEYDPNQRLLLYQQIEKQLLDDVAAIPIVVNVIDVLVNPRVQGFILTPINSAYIQWLTLAAGNP